MDAPGNFKAPWWLRNPHSQTIWPYLVRQKQLPPLEQQRFELEDGDFIDLCWTAPRNAPVVLILHGLEGSIHSHYAAMALSAIERLGWNGLFMHFRGCSGVPNRLARGYHSGDTGDLIQVLAYLRKKLPGSAIGAVGFSLGGNVLLKYLGEAGANSAIQAAVAVSVPFELDRCADRLNVGFSRIYRRHLLRRLKKRMRAKYHLGITGIPPAILDRLHTFPDFDDRVTAPLHGFADAGDYYRKSSSRQFLGSILRPTLIIQSRDDPFLLPDIIPVAEELSASVVLEVTEHGGHAGFMTGSGPLHTRSWLEERIPEFFSQALAGRTAG